MKINFAVLEKGLTVLLCLNSRTLMILAQKKMPLVVLGSPGEKSQLALLVLVMLSENSNVKLVKS